MVVCGLSESNLNFPGGFWPKILKKGKFIRAGHFSFDADFSLVTIVKIVKLDARIQSVVQLNPNPPKNFSQ